MKLLLLPLLLGFSVPAIAHNEANSTRTYNFAITVDPENPPHMGVEIALIHQKIMSLRESNLFFCLRKG